MTDELRPDDVNAAQLPLQRQAEPPRRDRWLMPLIVAGCTLAGVAVGFVLGQRVALHAPPAVAERATAHVFVPDFDVDFGDDDDETGHFAFNFRGHHAHRHGLMAPVPPVPPLPPMPPLGPRELVVDGCNDDQDCTTIIKRRADGSVVIVKTPK